MPSYDSTVMLLTSNTDLDVQDAEQLVEHYPELGDDEWVKVVSAAQRDQDPFRVAAKLAKKLEDQIDEYEENRKYGSRW
ncbi:hypothetical protein [Parendozoicomonas haliclonae]|uniref:Uncharacterized protein n=1 Tax=Parendozoicomonas haliclonae TaxID=1960125 RepID=A0A1X7AEK7_9GAMM|nr:hypothetical protein [Parendozoicomonas haliclonae]SMA33458.1 hypothetical protein EHSB41UT_00285 [Parendozoicomonas haliclonae]